MFKDFTGIPCRHACATLIYRHQKPEDFVDGCSSGKRYALCYNVAISLINGMDMWFEVETYALHSLLYKKGPDTPKKLMFRELGDGGSKIMRVGLTYKCTKCDKKAITQEDTKKQIRIQML